MKRHSLKNMDPEDRRELLEWLADACDRLRQDSEYQKALKDAGQKPKGGFYLVDTDAWAADGRDL